MEQEKWPFCKNKAAPKRNYSMQEKRLWKKKDPAVKKKSTLIYQILNPQMKSETKECMYVEL